MSDEVSGGELVAVRRIVIDNMKVRGHPVTREMQCMILGATGEGCSHGSVAMWLHYWTGLPVRECDRIVDSVVAVCVLSKFDHRPAST